MDLLVFVVRVKYCIIPDSLLTVPISTYLEGFERMSKGGSSSTQQEWLLLQIAKTIVKSINSLSFWGLVTRKRFICIWKKV